MEERQSDEKSEDEGEEATDKKVEHEKTTDAGDEIRYPLQANVQWEITRRPKSQRATSKPDWLDQNAIVTKVEKEEK